MKKLLTKRALTSSGAILIYLMIFNFVIHVTTGWQYGLFLDENYYFSMSNHLDFGYVDVTPITAWLMALLLGDSIPAMRVFPALAGSFTMLFAALTARKMGGGRFAQALSALAVMLAPSYLAAFSMFIYDAFDQLMSAAVIFIAAKILIGEESPKTWIVFGLILGIGIMVKVTMAFLILSLAFGLLLTPARRYFAGKWLWISAAIAFACFILYIFWQWTHGFPIVDYLLLYTPTRTITPTPLQLLLNIWFSMNPLSVLLWLGGLILLLTKRGRAFRPFAFAFIFYFALAAVLYIKFYALLGALIPLTAFGAACLENNYCRTIPANSIDTQQIKKRRLSAALKASYTALVCLAGFLLAPLSMPVLPPSDTASYNNALGISQIVQWETMQNTGLPFLLSGRLGWEELAAAVSEVYHALPESDRDNCGILCMNYGEAGAINYYSKKYGIPQAISGHLSHYYWGWGDYDGSCLIIVGERLVSARTLKYTFEEVTAVRGPHAEYALLHENDNAIYVCKGLKIPLDEYWKSIRQVQ